MRFPVPLARHPSVVVWAFLFLVAGTASAASPDSGSSPASARAVKSGANWPQWRGPSFDGISPARNVPVKWGLQDGVVWRFPLPGPAGSTPVVWGDRLFLTSVNPAGDLLLLCVGTDGKLQWQQTVATGNRDARGDEGNSASNSPCTDGKHVWAMMANGTLACYTVQGEPAWKQELQNRYGPFSIQFGMTSTPVLDGDRLYVQLIHGDMRTPEEQALLVCLDAGTGAEVWKHPRQTGATQENKHSYSSPVLYEHEGERYLVSHGGDYVTAHRLTDGSELWRYCLNPKGVNYHPTLRFVASPLPGPGFVVAPSAKNGPVVCIKGDARGDLTEQPSAILWRRDQGTPDVPSPVYHDGLVYLCRENGNLVCVEATTGKTVYEERTTPDRHRASPVLAEGKLYLTARNGIVTVVQTGRQFKILAQNELGEPISSTPVLADGRVYLRTFDALYAVGK
jgi:outer membrane protein assembly factor BamB